MGLSVLDGPFHRNPQIFPVTGFLGNFFGDRQEAYLGGQGRCGADLTSGAPQVHNFGLIRVEVGRHGGDSWCQMNSDSGQPKKVPPLPPLNQKLKKSMINF